VWDGFIIDITDRKKTELELDIAQEAVRKSEELYRQLTVASPDAILACDRNSIITYASPKAKALFVMPDNIIDTKITFSNYVHPHDRQKAQTLFQMFLEEHASSQPQLLLLREDGSDFFGELSSATVKDDEGAVTTIIMVVRDITERRRSETELIRAKEKAEESDKLKSSFLANMSHEIRTPINGINGFLNFIGDENLSPKRRKEYITVVQNSSSQLIRIIDDIIDIAKIEAQQMKIRPLTFQLNNFMKELFIFFETFLKSNKKDKVMLVLEDDRFTDQCVILSDPVRLRQVITNLIGNASKFTEKGFIGFGYKLLPPGKLEFWVEDTGIGLPADQLEVIFERFRQVEQTNHRKYGGTGLGLTISRSLVQMMGGRISVESVEGQGSTFRFTISYIPVEPVDEPVFSELRTEQPEEDMFFNKTSILLVEPEELSAHYYEKILTWNGAKTIMANTVNSWVETVSQQTDIDLVLVGANVFDRAGLDAYLKVKSVRAGMPLVLIVPERNDYYDKMIKILNCTRVIEGTPSYEMLCEEIMRCI
jgi:PAS domain S-box-containing protein